MYLCVKSDKRALTYNFSALFFKRDSDFHYFHVYKILSQFFFTITVVDIIFIHFYQSQSSSRLSLKSLRFNNADEKRTAIIQRDCLNKSFKTNRKIESSLQSKLTEDIRVRDKDIIKIQRYEKLI